MFGARTAVAAGLGLLLVTGGIAAAARSSAPDSAASSIPDDRGRALVQHGFSTAGTAKKSVDGMPHITEDDLATEYADMGTNFVRFLISWRMVEPEPGVYDQEYLDGVEERIGWYADRGYHVMLDMHQDLWGPAAVPPDGGGNGAPAWATYTDGLPVRPQEQWELYYLEPGVIRAFDNFWNTTGEHPELVDHYAGAWRAVAERFADNETVVAYDLMNEPYGGTLQGPAFESGPLTRMYQKAVDAIREVDDKTWACLEPQALGFNWGLPSALGAVDDPREGEPRIAFCPHLYPLPMDLGEGFSGSSRGMVEWTVSSWRANTLRTAEALGDVPVILGEFGLDTTLPGAEDYLDLVYRTADDAGIGVAYWSRDDGSWGPYEEDGTPRNLVDVLDRPYPRAVAADLHGWSSTPDRLEISVTPSGSTSTPSEVYLPAGTFPDGGVVEGGTVTGWDAEKRILAFTIDGERGERSTLVVRPR